MSLLKSFQPSSMLACRSPVYRCAVFQYCCRQRPQHKDRAHCCWQSRTCPMAAPPNRPVDMVANPHVRWSLCVGAHQADYCTVLSVLIVLEIVVGVATGVCLHACSVYGHTLAMKDPRKFCPRNLIFLPRKFPAIRYDFSQGGDLPVRAKGSRWISYKRCALQLVWRARQTRILVGCALYVDILKPPSLLSLTLQHDQLDLVLGYPQDNKVTEAIG